MEFGFNKNVKTPFLRVRFVLARCSLYTTDGVKVGEPSQLVHGAAYVAVGSELGGHFQPRDYGLTRLRMDRGRRRYPFQWRKLSSEYATHSTHNDARLQVEHSNMLSRGGHVISIIITFI